MRLGIITTSDLTDPSEARRKARSEIVKRLALRHEVHMIELTKGRTSPLIRFRDFVFQKFHEYFGTRKGIPGFHPSLGASYAEELADKIKRLPALDAVICLDGCVPIQEFETDLPVFVWSDAPAGALLQIDPALRDARSGSKAEVRSAERKVFQRLKGAVFSSEWAGQKCTELYGLPSERILSIPKPLSVKPVHSDEQILESRDKHFAASPSKRVSLVFFSSDWVRSGGEQAVRIARELSRQGKKVQLHLFGDVPPLPPVAGVQIKSHGQVLKALRAKAKNLETVLMAADFVLMPASGSALPDTWPQLVFEANYFGCPVIAAAIAGMSSQVQNHRTGLLVPPDSGCDVYVRMILESVDQSDKHRKMSQGAFKAVRSEFSWDSSVERFEEFLEQSLKESLKESAKAA